MDNNFQPTIVTPQENIPNASAFQPPKSNHTGLIIFIIVMALLSAGATAYILFSSKTELTESPPEAEITLNQIIKSSATPSALLVSTNSANLNSSSESATLSAFPTLKATPSAVATATPDLLP